LASLAEAADHITAGSLADAPVGLVGLELEAHCFDVADPARRPEWPELCDVIASVPDLPGASAVTVEPGGAVELSTPPMRGVLDAVDALRADRAVLRTVFARAGLGLVLLGADPLRPPRRVNPGARYRAMEKHFVAAGTGAAGAAMMTSTASVQVNVDAGPAAGWADRVRLAHALGPTMIAISANSPLLAGAFSGWRSTRQRVWGQLDTARCGPVLGVSGDDPASDWARYAMRAPVMLVREPGGAAVPVVDYVAFADWVDGQADLAGRRPTTADLDYHLTTLFPPVRPRRWLEIRYLDSVPDALGRRWCSRSSPCSTIRRPPPPPPKPPSRSPPPGTSRPASASPIADCTPARLSACKRPLRRRRPRSTTRCSGWCDSSSGPAAPARSSRTG